MFSGSLWVASGSFWVVSGSPVFSLGFFWVASGSLLGRSGSFWVVLGRFWVAGDFPWPWGFLFFVVLSCSLLFFTVPFLLFSCSLLGLLGLLLRAP